MTYNDIGFFVVLAIVLVASTRASPYYPRRIFRLGLLAAVLGSVVRYEVLARVYGGRGDALRYFEAGAIRANEIWRLEITPFSPAYWSLRGSRWGTGFVEQVSGIVIALIGETLRGEFLAFAAFGFAGTYLLAQAAREVNLRERVVAFAYWTWLWPSVWYWPSSVGKEALILLAFGMTTYGYVGRGGRQRWSWTALGFALAWMVRPHVAAVLAMAMVLAHVLVPVRGALTYRRIGQVIFTLALAVFVVRAAQVRLGLADADLEGVREYAEAIASQTEQGGSTIGAPTGLTAPVQAVINVWARPFVWEASGVTGALAALEILLLWWLVWICRADIRITLRDWRNNRLLRFAAPLVVGYTIMIGMTFGNLGLIARQRAPMFPFLLLLIAGAGATVPNYFRRFFRRRRGSALPAGRGAPAAQSS